MANPKKVSKKIAKVSDVNSEIVNSEVSQMVANEIVNTEIVPVSDIPVDSEIDELSESSNLSDYKILKLEDVIIVREDNRLSGMDKDSISEFAKVLKRDGGVRQPIEVYFDRISQKYRVISGHRRYLASIEAGFSNIKTMVYPEDTAELMIFRMRISENIDRVDLSPIDMATWMKHANEKFRMTKKAVAELFSLQGTRKYYGADVTKLISLLDLPEQARKQIADGTMTLKTAYDLVEADDKTKNIADKALKAMQAHIENAPNKKQSQKLTDLIVQEVAKDNPESGIPIHETPELTNSEIETSEVTPTTESTENSELVGKWKDSQNPESRIDPSLKLTPESMFPEKDEPTPVSSRRSSADDITPPTSQNESQNESDFDVEAQLKAAGKETRNKEMSKESIIGLLTFLETGTQGFPICGFLEDLMSAIVGHEDAMSRIEMVELLKEFVLAPKKSKKK
jgi:ParB family chromosome partitioning protein